MNFWILIWGISTWDPHYRRTCIERKMLISIAIFWIAAPCSLAEVYRRIRGACALIALMMEAARTSETSVNFYQTARRNNPEDSCLHTRRRENLKSHNVNCLYDSVFSRLHCVCVCACVWERERDREIENEHLCYKLRYFLVHLFHTQLKCRSLNIRLLVFLQIKK
jgi:hypothetical protein